jgi:hypothetical protein
MKEHEIVETARKLLKGYPFRFLDRTPSDIGDRMTYVEFMSCVEDGGITDDDGCVGEVLVDGHVTNIQSPFGGAGDRWDGYDMSFEEIGEIDGKIEIEWCNK